jgi:hypothetical protein
MFSGAVMRSVAIAVPWAAGAVAVGDPLLGGLPPVLDAVRKRITSPTLVLPIEWVQWPGHLEALRAMGARPWSAPRGASVQGSPLEVGPFLAVASSPGDTVRLFLRPAMLGQTSPAALLPMLSADGLALVQSAIFLLSRDAEEIVKRAQGSPLPSGEWEANPAQSAPGLVDAATLELGVAAEAAQLFLQLLALPAPTKVQVLKWNGWSSSGWTRAAKALVDSGLVTTGQRARSGRDLFLAGPWSELSAPDLPVETWKLSLYGAELRTDGSVRKPLDRLVPLRPLHQLFADAWRRWSSGERPGFEEIPGRR